MPRILSYALFEAQREPRLTKAQTQWLDRHVRSVRWRGGSSSWTLNPRTGLVDVKGDIFPRWSRLKTFQGVRFGRVSGSFLCDINQLISLAGAPQEVGGGFNCEGNKLTSLEGAPQRVGGYFNCADNQLTSLAGAPQRVGGDFFCSKNDLTSLAGAPQEVGGNFRCGKNKLTSLAGAPREVGGDFLCYENSLTSLAGAPEVVEGSFECWANPLKSLEGAPRKIGKAFNCDAFRVDDCARHWHLDTWLEMLKGKRSRHFNIGDLELTRALLLPLVSPDALAGFFRQNPLELDLLDDYPELKQQVLELTGLPDTSGVAQVFRSGLI